MKPTFEECWVDFLSRTDQNKVAAEFLNNRLEELELKGAERVLSVGPGNGEVDIELMTLLPEIKLYAAMEPDAKLRATLQERVEAMGKNIQIELTPDTMESYKGPSESVDIILMVHVCYYFKDTFKAQIKRALQWLRPGGHLILVHKESSAFREGIESCVNSNKVEQTISIAWAISEEIKTMGIPYQEDHMEITLDWSSPGLASIVRIFTNIYPDDQQLEECMKIAKRHSPEGVTKVHENQVIHVIPQTAVGSLT